MVEFKRNYYGSLCTEMYEILHAQAPANELEFYLSYAHAGQKILEPMCGNGRFFVPFLERGLDICGIDLSAEMLLRLRQKAPASRIVHTDILSYTTSELFDYIFIPSGSISLFTDMEQCSRVLRKTADLLSPDGIFLFAVDTVFDRCPEDLDYKVRVKVQTGEGYDLVLKTRNHYDENSQTQFSPSIYELYQGTELLQSEYMDFQTHLYRWGEMDEYLKDCGFSHVIVYSGYDKTSAVTDQCESLLYECRK